MAVVGVFDSGSGGLSVLGELIARLPGSQFVYYSDNAHCPYGDKTPEFITERSRCVCAELIDRGADAIVVACNTATSAAVATLRSELSIPLIGMEPAVKPAVGMTRSGVVGVLATAATLKGRKYLDIKAKYSSQVTITEGVGHGFVELVEALQLDGDETEALVRASLEPLIEAGADTIVLGCTHYPFLLPVMRRIAPDVQFVNPAPAIARHLEDVLLASGIALEDANPGVDLLASGPDVTLRRLFAHIRTND